MFRKINATVLIVQDLDKCTRFYRDTLGLEVSFTDENSIGFRMQDHDFLLLKYTVAVDEISLQAVTAQTGGTRVMLCAHVPDARAAHAALIAKGVQFFKPPTDQPWGRCTTTFGDPEGNLWELYHELPKQ
jgi:catechol 2,3-dioxygenase-like lactoylglutathione lyase family enzyme